MSHNVHDEGNTWQGDNDDRGDEGDQSDLILFDSAALPELTTNWHSEGGNAQIILGSHDNDKDYYVDDDDGDYNDDIVVDDDDQIIMAVKAMLRMMTRIAMRMMPGMSVEEFEDYLLQHSPSIIMMMMMTIPDSNSYANDGGMLKIIW